LEAEQTEIIKRSEKMGILSSFGISIVKGMGSEVGGEVAGWALSKIFGDSGTPKSDPEVLNSIKDLSSQLSGVADSVKFLNTQINDDMNEIEKELQAIQQEQLYISWETRDKDLQKYITQQNIQYQRYLDYTKTPKETSQMNIQEIVTQILDTNNGAEQMMGQINTLLVGSGKDKGVLQLFSEMMEPLILNGTVSCYRALDSYFNYYRSAAYAQQQSLYLLIEAFHQRGDDSEVENEHKKYQENVKSQEIPFLSRIEYMLLEQIKYGASEPSISFDNYSAAQDYQAQGYFFSYYKPTPVRAEAEKILADSLCLKDDENRIVVWMIYPTLAGDGSIWVGGHSRNFDPTDYEIGLQPIGNQDMAAISPGYVNQVSIINNPNKNLPPESISASHMFKRMVYSDLAPGNYSLQDLNGKPGLEPADGSIQKSIYFQDKEKGQCCYPILYR